jgi:hypothetical protein
VIKRARTLSLPILLTCIFSIGCSSVPATSGISVRYRRHSYVPGEAWTASFLNWAEAEQGYQDFNREFPIIVGEDDGS